MSPIPQEIDPDPPIIVGCSAGVGRTGSFIALASLLRGYGFLPPAVRPTSPSVLPSSPLGPLPEFLRGDDVVQEIDSLREQRPTMVQRSEQVLLVYEVLAKAFGIPLI
jgi:protein-tyrosine phosphatase